MLPGTLTCLVTRTPKSLSRACLPAAPTSPCFRLAGDTLVAPMPCDQASTDHAISPLDKPMKGLGS